MAITLVATSPVVYGNNFGVTPAYPAGIQAGDLIVYNQGLKGSWSNWAAPAGWCFMGQVQAGAGSQGNDTGPVLTSCMVRIADGTESGNAPSLLTGGSPNVLWGVLHVYRKAAGSEWDIMSMPWGSDPATGAQWQTEHFQAYKYVEPSGGSGSLYVGVGGTNDFARAGDFAAGDTVHYAGTTATDIGAGTAFSNFAMSGNGVAAGPFTKTGEYYTSTGQDIGGFTCYGPVTAPNTGWTLNASQQPVYLVGNRPLFTASIGGTTTNQAGSGVVLRLRELTPGPAPTGVTASTGQLEQVTVTWLTEPTAVKYHVYRDLVLIATVDAPTTEWVDTEAAGVVPLTNYSYTVRAEQANTARSPHSTAVLGQSAIGLPINLVVEPRTTGALTLEWTNKTAYAASYRIVRDGITIHTTAVQPQTGKSSYVDTGRTQDVVHSYEVYVRLGATEGATPATRQAAAAKVKVCRPLTASGSYPNNGRVTWTNSATETLAQQLQQHPSLAPIDLNRYVQIAHPAAIYSETSIYFDLQAPWWKPEVLAAPGAVNPMDDDYFQGVIWKKPVKLGFYVTGYDFASAEGSPYYSYFKVWGGGDSYFGPSDGAIVANLRRQYTLNNGSTWLLLDRPELQGQWVEVEYDWSNRAAVKALNEDWTVQDYESNPLYAREWRGWSRPDQPDYSPDYLNSWGEGARAGVILSTGTVAQTVRIHAVTMTFAVGIGPEPPDDLEVVGLSAHSQYIVRFTPVHPQGDAEGAGVMQYGFVGGEQYHPGKSERPTAAQLAAGKYDYFSSTPYELEGYVPARDENGRQYHSTPTGVTVGDLAHRKLAMVVISAIGTGQQHGPRSDLLIPEGPGVIPDPTDFKVWPKAGELGSGGGLMTFLLHNSGPIVPFRVERDDALGQLATIGQTYGGFGAASVANSPKQPDTGALVPFTPGVPVKLRAQVDTSLWPQAPAHVLRNGEAYTGDQRGDVWWWGGAAGNDPAAATQIAVWQRCERLAPIQDITITGRHQDASNVAITTLGQAFPHVDENLDDHFTTAVLNDGAHVMQVVNSTYTAAARYEALLAPLAVAGYEPRDAYIVASLAIQGDTTEPGMVNSSHLITLLQGTTVIKAMTKAEMMARGWRNVQNGFGGNIFVYRLTDAERALITDWSNLRLRVDTSRALSNWNVATTINSFDLRVGMAPVGYVAPPTLAKTSSDAPVVTEVALLRESLPGKLPPDAIASSSGTTGVLGYVQDDPDNPDALWLDAAGQPDVRFTFPLPPKPLHPDGANAFRLRLRPDT